MEERDTRVDGTKTPELLVDFNTSLDGTWRRSQGTVTIQTWRHLSRSARDAVEMEAESLPLPGTPGPIVVRWD